MTMGGRDELSATVKKQVALMGPDAAPEADAEFRLVDVETAEIEVDLHLRAVLGTDFVTAEIAAAESDLKQELDLSLHYRLRKT